jgi:hypothetical protein
MGIFGKITQGIIDVATTPIDIVKDVATLGGVNTDQDEPYTVQKIKKLSRKAKEIYEELDE